MATRGIRNNNPLNIRRGGSNWVGLKEKQTDKQFCQFVSMSYGFRAAFRLVYNYIRISGLKTVREIINRWAPAEENPTKVYLYFVCNQGGFRPDYEIFDKHDIPRAYLMNLVWYMSLFESGKGILKYTKEFEEGYENFIKFLKDHDECYIS